MSSTLRALDGFIAEWRSRYAVRDNNRFGFSLGTVKTYYRFLELILSRYRRANAQYTRNRKALLATLNSNRFDSAALTAINNQSAPIVEKIHLECESFFLFGTILLDRIACFVEEYFGQPEKGRINSHRNLKNKLSEYAKDKNLVLPDSMLESVLYLENNLADFRDKHVTHDKSWRSMALTAWRPVGDSGISSIGRGKLYPNPSAANGEQVDGKSPDELLMAIDAYIAQIMSLVESNAAKTRFELEHESLHGTDPRG